MRSIVCPWEQKKRIVEIIKAAAMFMREHLQDTALEADVFLKDQLLASIARVIWTQNISIATSMIGSSPIAANYLKVSSSENGNELKVAPSVFLAYMDLPNGEISTFCTSLDFSNGEIQTGTKNMDFSIGEIHLCMHICTYLGYPNMCICCLY